MGMDRLPSATPDDRIWEVRGHRVMFDTDLAFIYGTSTKRLNEQVRRNRERFPDDFMFQLTEDEAGSLRSRFATSRPGWGGRRYLPYVFTEHGAVMLANVLKTPRAAAASIAIARAFVRLRSLFASKHELTQKLEELEKRVGVHDGDIQAIFEAIRRLMDTPRRKAQRIGFRPG
ncbi:MAG: ORF6N domain-containing protein [Elusimicrobia bacterium]|nr:ORF6N domain-containing protein [Elusimicrobiota bacterium]